MKRGKPDYPDPDDMFADTRMTFGEHIEDLRTHLLRAGFGFLIGFLIAIPLGGPLLRFISAPVEEQLKRFNDRYNHAKSEELRELQVKGELDNLPPLRIGIDVNVDLLVEVLRQRLGLPAEERPKRPVLDHMLPSIESLLAALGVDDLVDWKKVDQTHYVRITGKVADPLAYAEEMHKFTEKIRPNNGLRTFSVQEAFVVLVKVIMMTGLVLASPWVFFQLWSFIAAGLYPSEKRLVNVYLPYSVILFLTGIFTCQFLVIPKAIAAMLWFNEYLGFQPDLRLSEWLGFAIFTPLVFGISFQTPLAMFTLERVGLLTVEIYKSKRRIAWFLMAAFAAIITPTVDAVSMLLLWLPMCLLYELGIWMCQFSARPREEAWETSESEEMIEV